MRGKQGVELSIGMIIVVVLGLLVLGILAYLIIRNISPTNNATACEPEHGRCIPVSTQLGKSTCADNEMQTGWICDKGYRCCSTP